jgi:hypothetical protein
MHKAIAKMASLADGKPEERTARGTAFLPDSKGLRTPTQQFGKIAEAQGFLLTANAY